MNNKIVICLDFDGSCVHHVWPNIGNDLPNAVNVIKKIISAGHHIVINTMRDGKELVAAQEWFRSHEIPIYGVNRNPTQNWTKSPKVYGNIYIDDAALGTPLMNYGILKNETCSVIKEKEKVLNEVSSIVSHKYIDIVLTKDDKIYILDPELQNMNSDNLIYGYIINESHEKEKIMIKASDVYIDVMSRDFIDWYRIEELLKKMKLIC